MATESEMMYITVNKQIVNGERSTLCKSVKLCKFVEDMNLLISNTLQKETKHHVIAHNL